MKKGPQTVTLKLTSKQEKDSTQMINCCETEENLKQPNAPDLRSSQADSTARESEQSQGSRKQRESSIK